MVNFPLPAEKDIPSHQNKPKKQLWFWGCVGCLILICVTLSLVSALLYTSKEPYYPLKAKISVPPTVIQGEQFDLVVAITNTTKESIFLERVYFSDTPFYSPNVLSGVHIISVEPVDKSFYVDGQINKGYYIDGDIFAYEYFQVINSNETLTVIIHMQAKNAGSYQIYCAGYTTNENNPFQDKTLFEIDVTKIEISP